MWDLVSENRTANSEQRTMNGEQRHKPVMDNVLVTTKWNSYTNCNGSQCYGAVAHRFTPHSSIFCYNSCLSFRPSRFSPSFSVTRCHSLLSHSILTSCPYFILHLRYFRWFIPLLNLSILGHNLCFLSLSLFFFLFFVILYQCLLVLFRFHCTSSSV